MNEHLNAKISANQLLCALGISHLSVLIFIPKLCDAVTAAEMVFSTVLSAIFMIPMLLSANKEAGKISKCYRVFTAVYLIYAASLSASWMYGLLLSVMNDAPNDFLFGLIIIGIAFYAVYCGIESIVRAALPILSVFLLCMIAAVVKFSGQMSVVNLSTMQSAAPSNIIAASIFLVFSQLEFAEILLLKSNLAQQKKKVNFGKYLILSLLLIASFYFFLELTFGRGIYLRSYPAVLLFGKIIAYCLFCVLTVMRFSLAAISCTVSLNGLFGYKKSVAVTFCFLAVILTLIMNFRRYEREMNIVLVCIGGIVYLWTMICFLRKEK